MIKNGMKHGELDFCGEPGKKVGYWHMLHTCATANTAFEHVPWLNFQRHPWLGLWFSKAELLFLGMGPFATVLLLLTSLYQYCQFGCPLSFGQGSYLRMTWHLEHLKHYRTLAVLTCLPSMVGMFVCWSVFCVVLSWQQRWTSPAEQAYTIIQTTGVDFILLLLSLKSLIRPSMPIHEFGADIDHITFKRDLLNMVSQSNDAMGIALVSSLYGAEHGNKGELRKLLRDDADDSHVSDVIAACAKGEEAAGIYAMVEIAGFP